MSPNKQNVKRTDGSNFKSQDTMKRLTVTEILDWRILNVRKAGGNEGWKEERRKVSMK